MEVIAGMVGVNNTNLTESTEDDIKYKLSDLDEKFRTIIATQGTFSTFANLTVIILFAFLGAKRKKFANYLLFCTSLSDMFISGLSWYMFMISYMNVHQEKFPQFENIVYVSYLFQDYSFVVSLGTVLLSTIDRFISVKIPLLHREITLKPYSKCIILLIWGISIIPPITRLCLNNFDYRNLYDSRDVIYIYCLHSIILIVIITIFILLIKTFTTVRGIISNPIKGSCRTRGYSNTMQKRNRRLVKIFMAMISAYAITYLPIIIAMILYTSGYLDTMDEYYIVLLTVFADTFYLFSSLINPIITITFKEDYRHTLCGFFMKSKIMRGSSGGSSMASKSELSKEETTASSVL